MIRAERPAGRIDDCEIACTQSIDMQWWDSTAAVYQLAQWLTYAAVAGGLTSVFSWSSLPRLAVSTAVMATAALAFGLFAWFRLAHLRDLSQRR